MLIDSHCHLDRVDLSRYQDDFSEFVEATTASGVEHMLCVCIDLEHYDSMLGLVEAHPSISVSVGVHPNEEEGREPEVEELVRLARHPKNVAIGETGLDYFHGDENGRARQQERFRRHIEAAKQAGKPLIIHTRDAREDTIALMRERQADRCGGVMHCFTETWEMARQALDLGFYISFSGIVTFKNAAELREVAKRVPLERLLIETDSPYLAPVPYRGKPNEPRYVAQVAALIAELRGLEAEELARVTRENYFALFGGSPGD